MFFRKNKGITLLALVITIIIMLLLAAVAMQMAFGENGLIVKSTQARIEQAKTELLEGSTLQFTEYNMDYQTLRTRWSEFSKII
ncbi:MAG: hypothetical protein HXK70_04690 [Clostridiales bacterium]|nr:hypothetical protein [Clostridiales bacterium]